MRWRPYRRTLTRSQLEGLKTTADYPPPSKYSPPNSGISKSASGGIESWPKPSSTSRSSAGFAGKMSSDMYTAEGIIDLSPSEFRRVSNELGRVLSRSALRRLLQQIVGLASRWVVPLRVLKWALDLLDWLNRNPDRVRPEDAGEWRVQGSWRVSARCTNPDVATYGAALTRYEWGTRWDWFWDGFAETCLKGQALPASAIGDPVHRNAQVVCYAAGPNLLDRYQMRLTIRRDGSGPGYEDDQPVPTMVPDYAIPAADPLPVPRVSDWPKSSSEWPQADKRGNSPSVDTPTHVDVGQQVEQWVLTGGPPRRVETYTPYPDRGLPGPGVREKKIRIVVAGRARRILDFVGESADFVECMWEALPKEARSKKYWRPGMKQPAKPTPQRMAYEVWKAYGDEKLGWKYLNDAFDCIVINQIEDYAWGSLGKISGKAGSAIRRPVGIMTGPAL